jgi:hypothetical protein
MAVNACTIAGRKIKGAVEEAGALNFLLLWILKNRRFISHVEENAYSSAFI